MSALANSSISLNQLPDPHEGSINIFQDLSFSTKILNTVFILLRIKELPYQES